MTTFTLPADTSPAAARAQIAVLQRMGLAGRAAQTFELSDSLRAVVASGVRSRHPEYTEKQVRWAVFRLTLGERLFARAFPDIDVRP